MGVLFISITTGFVILVFILIIYFRRKKIRNKPEGPASRSVVEEKTGKDKGIYD